MSDKYTSNLQYGNNLTNNPLILFDIGAVLLELNYGRFKQETSSLGVASDFFSSYSSLELSDLKGEFGPGEFFSQAKKLLEYTKTMSDFEAKKTIELCWGDQAYGMVNLKEQLAKKGYNVGLLSNIGTFSHKVLEEKHPAIFETFGGPKVYSYEVGAVKPAAAMFDAVPKSYSPVIYIDDNLSYLTAAEKLGWKGIHFTPYIDNSEIVRSAQRIDSEYKSNLKVADSIDALIDILNEFGIKA